MSLIGKKVEDFTVQAYQNEEFREINFEKDVLGNGAYSCSIQQTLLLYVLQNLRI